MKKFAKLLAILCCFLSSCGLILVGCDKQSDKDYKQPEEGTTFTLTLDYTQGLFADMERWQCGPKSDATPVTMTFDEQSKSTTFSFGQDATYVEQIYLSLPMESGWKYTWEFSYQSSIDIVGENKICAQIFDQPLVSEDTLLPVAEKNILPTTSKQSNKLEYQCTQSKDYYMVVHIGIAEQASDFTLNVSGLKLSAQKSFDKNVNNYAGLPTPQVIYLRETDAEYNEYFAGSGYDNMEFAGWMLALSDSEYFQNGDIIPQKEDHTLLAMWNPTIKKQEVESDNKGGCIVFGTPVMLADGSYKNIEDISFFDRIFRYNHDLGVIDTGYCHWINKHSQTDGSQEVIKVSFSDGGELTFVPPHAMFARNKNADDEYVYEYFSVTDSENFHAGTEVVKMSYNNGSPTWAWVTVESVSVSHDVVQYCQPIMGQMWNFFANNYLTNEADALGFHNMYGFDENLVYAHPLRQMVLQEEYLRDEEGNLVYGAGLDKDGNPTGLDKDGNPLPDGDVTYTLLDSFTFAPNINLPVHLYTQETMNTYFNMTKRDMLGYRGSEWQILVEWCDLLCQLGITSEPEFTKELIKYTIIRDTVNSENHKMDTIKNSQGEEIWIVTTDNTPFERINTPKTQQEIDEFAKREDVFTTGSTYIVPEYTGKNAENFSHWYCSADSKTYKPGDSIEVLYSTHFTAIFK